MHNRNYGRPLILLVAVLLAVLISPQHASCSKTAATSAVLTKDQAVKVLLDNVVKPASLQQDTIAFTLAQPLPAGTEVAAYAPATLPVNVTSLPDLVPQKLNDSTWFFWVDEYPLARFSHPSEFVFINASNGAVTVSNQAWWPYINGQEVQQWVESPGRWDSGNWAYSNVPSNEIPTTTTTNTSGEITPADDWTTISWDKPLTPGVSVSYGVPAGEAIVPVNGWSTGQNNAGFSQDMVHETQFGSSSQIPSYQPMGNGLNDIRNAITNARNGGATDILLYWTGHGGQAADGSSYLNFRGTPVTPLALSNIFQQYPNIKFKVVVDACYGGGFSSTLMATANVVSFFSASSATEISYGGGFAGGGSFSDGFWQGMLNVDNSPDLQAQAKANADANGLPEFVGWLEVAQTQALADDKKFAAGLTHPVAHVATPTITTTSTATTTTTSTTTTTTTPTTTMPTTTTTTSVPPGFDYTFQDNGSYSTVILKVSNMQPGWVATATVTGPGVSSSPQQSATYNGGQTQTNGIVTINWTVTVVGTYSINVTVVDSSGKTMGTYTNSEYVN